MINITPKPVIVSSLIPSYKEGIQMAQEEAPALINGVLTQVWSIVDVGDAPKMATVSISSWKTYQASLKQAVDGATS